MLPDTWHCRGISCIGISFISYHVLRSGNHLLLWSAIVPKYYSISCGIVISAIIEVLYLMLMYRRLGGAQPGNRFVSFVRAYARSGWRVELDIKFCGPAFSLFPFGLGELSLFSFGLGEFSLSPPSQTSYPTLVGLIGTIWHYIDNYRI